MGIVVTIAMLLGLVVLRPTPWRDGASENGDLRFVVFTSATLLLTGLWNALWYGLRNLDSFWGVAALVSGIIMILAAMIIFLESGEPVVADSTWVGSIRSLVVWALAACFLLYAVTLVQLNLGYPIIS